MAQHSRCYSKKSQLTKHTDCISKDMAPFENRPDQFARASEARSAVLLFKVRGSSRFNTKLISLV